MFTVVLGLVMALNAITQVKWHKRRSSAPGIDQTSIIKAQDTLVFSACLSCDAIYAVLKIYAGPMGIA